MASLLESVVAKTVAQGFKGRLCKCKLRVATTTALDAKGDEVPGTVVEYNCDGIRENLNAVWAVQAGIPLTDVGLLLILGSLPASVTPKKDDKVFVGKPFNTWHQVRQTKEIDPARASWRGAAYEIPAP